MRILRMIARPDVPMWMIAVRLRNGSGSSGRRCAPSAIMLTGTFVHWKFRRIQRRLKFVCAPAVKVLATPYPSFKPEYELLGEHVLPRFE
jgi:hypothetical protein